MENELRPIGIMPEYIWIEHRIIDLNEAIFRYISANKAVPEEWIEERNQHIKWLKDRR